MLHHSRGRRDWSGEVVTSPPWHRRTAQDPGAPSFTVPVLSKSIHTCTGTAFARWPTVPVGGKQCKTRVSFVMDVPVGATGNWLGDAEYRILLIEDALLQQFVLGSRGGLRHNEGNAVFRG